MREVDEFLKVVPIAFGDNYKISEYRDLPLFYLNAAKVLRLIGDKEIYVICFSIANMTAIFTLYSFLRRRNRFTYLYIPQGFEFENKKEYLLITKLHTNIVTSYGDVFTRGNRIDFLSYQIDELREEQKLAYTKFTQLVLKYYFLKEQRPHTTREISSFLNISPATVARANEVLFRLGVLKRNGYGAGIDYFLKDKKTILKQLKDYFIKPYDSSELYCIPNDDRMFLPTKVLAGQSALSEYTDLLPSSYTHTTYAVYKKDLISFKNAKHNLFNVSDERIICIQSYIYDPSLFSKNGVIDLFDLYLTMLFKEDLKDVRVKTAFDEIERMLTNE